MKETNEPRNAQEALQQARRHERALQIIRDGYTFHKDRDMDSVAVCKPGRLAASYFINDGECDCADRLKGNKCKHEYAWALLQSEQADNDANMAAQCALWEDQNYPLLPELPTREQLAIKDLARRMEADLQHVRQDIAAQVQRRTGYIHCQHQRDRAGRLENALVIISQYKPL